MTDFMNPEDANEASAQETVIRLYGVPQSGDSEEAYVTILFVGYKIGLNDVKSPTSRVFQLQRTQILEQGVVSDYNLHGEEVYYYDVSVITDVLETVTRVVQLGEEIAKASGGTFASLVANPPSRPSAEYSTLSTMTSSELKDLARKERDNISSGAIDPRACGTIRQTYSWTGSIFGPRPDPWGGDCDSLPQ